MVQEVGYPDWTFVYDLYHKPPTELSYNRRKTKRITKEVRDFYIPFGDKCLVCDRGHYGEKPDCLSICPCKTRTTDGKTLAIIDTRRNFRGIDLIPLQRGIILLPRCMIEFNYVHDLPFIFRACHGNDFHLHHRNGKPYDDRLENINITDIHRVIHGFHSTMNSGIRDLDRELAEGTINRRLRNSLAKKFERGNEMAEQMPESSRLWIYINDVARAVSAYEEFGEVPQSLKLKVKSHMMNGRRQGGQIGQGV